MAHQAGTRIGIIGGGQLARMLALACHEMGLIPVVLTENATDSAAQVAPRSRLGTVRDPKAFREFLENVDVVTFESEFIDIPTEGTYAFVREHAAKFFPALPLMAELQDRRSQKLLLTEYKIPTAPFRVVEDLDELLGAIHDIGFPCVLKKARGGYDGFGTFVLKNQDALVDFTAGQKWPGPCILEAFVPFRRELAVLFARSASGAFIQFPLVQSHQEDHRCDWVLGPMKSPHLKKLHAAFRRMMTSTGYVGLLAVELFETPKGLFVNELAPRVHNTGHYSQDALSESQFHLHLRSGLGQKIVAPAPRAPAFVMANLVGASERAFAFPEDLEGRLHWYGKQHNRPGRKMGHVNYVGKNGAALLKLALKERKGIRK